MDTLEWRPKKSKRRKRKTHPVRFNMQGRRRDVVSRCRGIVPVRRRSEAGRNVKRKEGRQTWQIALLRTVGAATGIARTRLQFRVQVDTVIQSRWMCREIIQWRGFAGREVGDEEDEVGGARRREARGQRAMLAVGQKRKPSRSASKKASPRAVQRAREPVSRVAARLALPYSRIGKVALFCPPFP